MNATTQFHLYHAIDSIKCAVKEADTSGEPTYLLNELYRVQQQLENVRDKL